MAEYNRNPLITERNAKALLVACPYCGVGIGMQCWTVRTIDQPLAGLIKRYPHHQRIKASWRTNGTAKN